MQEKLPINDLLDVVRFVCKFGGGLAKSFKDGKLDWTDVINFKDALGEVPEVLSGFENIIPQIKDLDSSEIQEVKNVVIEELADVVDIDVKWLEIAQESVNIASSIFKIVKLIKGE